MSCRGAIAFVAVLVGIARFAGAGGFTVVEACASPASLAQPPTSPQSGFPAFSGSGDGIRAYDDFSGVSGPITGITWWGGGSKNCLHEGAFEIAFYKNNGGQPGALLSTQRVTPVVTETGFASAQGPLYRHVATLATPVNLASGWLSVYAVDFQGCFFYWGSSALGNANAYYSIGVNLQFDLAFCLTSTGSFAPVTCLGGANLSQPPTETLQTPGFSDDGDGIRTYDNFSGLAGPITRVVWWGGGSVGGNNCVRAPSFQIAFAANNGGQPGATITTRTVTATAQKTGLQSQLGTIYRYEAALSPPVDLAAGWVSVFALNFTDCFFYWANGSGGDNLGNVGNSSVNADFAWCLVTEDGYHAADQNKNNVIALQELLRLIQYFNSSGLGCDMPTLDGYAPNASDQNCVPHNSDYSPQNWVISLPELLRLIQFFNSGGYSYCPGFDPPTADGFCAGAP